MKLYLKIPPMTRWGTAERLFKEGKWFAPVNPQTQTPDKTKKVLLFPDVATEVADDVAKRLLEQDAHLVSKKPTPRSKFENLVDPVSRSSQRANMVAADDLDYSEAGKNANPNVMKGATAVNPMPPQVYADPETPEEAEASGRAEDIEKNKAGSLDFDAYAIPHETDQDTVNATIAKLAEANFEKYNMNHINANMNRLGFRIHKPCNIDQARILLDIALERRSKEVVNKADAAV